MIETLNLSQFVTGEWIFISYITVVVVGALFLCYLDENRSSNASVSAAVFPLWFPEESIPWDKLNRIDFFSDPLGLGLTKLLPSFFRRDAPQSPGGSKPPQSTTTRAADEIHLAYSTKLHAYFGYFVLTVLGFMREAFWTISLKKNNHHKEAWNSLWWKEFFTQHMYRNIEECWGRPISSAPSTEIQVCLRKRRSSNFFSQLWNGFQPLELTGEEKTCINMASYNYLGFGGIDKDCTPACVEAIRKYGISFGVTRSFINGGSSPLHLALEKEVATFLGKEDAIVMGMGFATNSTLIPAVVCDAKGSAKNVLIISDELNHKSIVEGCRLSGASIKSFKHSDMQFLENLLIEETGKKCWRKIFIFVEGVYSMEGGFCTIREIVRLKRKYNCYVWLDEAHSIGGVGPTGRGVTELFNVPTKYIDIMMGTFTKSFGSAGGYIACDRALCDQVRRLSVGFIEASSMTPVCAQQALSSFTAMQSPRGMKKIKQLRDNSAYFRNQLVSLGCRVIGDLHSPVMCAMLVHPDKINSFSTECLKRNLAVVVVGYPATPVLLSRVRFCLSAAHSQKDLDKVLKILNEVVDVVGIRYAEGEEPLDVVELQKIALSTSLGEDKDTISYWTPDPLVVELSSNASKDEPISAQPGVVDASRVDPLRLLASPPDCIVSAAIAKLKEVGCGTCGPRGFYGTTTDHLRLEKTIAEFLGTEAAIMYSHHVSTTSSVIPAFIKKDDLVLLRSDPINSCSLIASGVKLSRAVNVSVWSNVETLEALLAAAVSSTTKRTDPYFRIWIVCEGGVAHLDMQKIVQLKLSYGAYLLLDDTMCIGATGATGRGTVEKSNVNIDHVDILIGSFEHAFGSVGGFCAGRSDIIEHQRLYGDGYCFSASAPSCLTVASIKGIEYLQTDNGKNRLEQLQANLDLFATLLNKSSCVTDNSIVRMSAKSCFSQIIKLPETTSAAQFCKSVGKSFKCEPLHVSPLGLSLFSKFQPENFGKYANRLVRINLHAEMSSEHIQKIVNEIESAVKINKK